MSQSPFPLILETFENRHLRVVGPNFRLDKDSTLAFILGVEGDSSTLNTLEVVSTANNVLVATDGMKMAIVDVARGSGWRWFWRRREVGATERDDALRALGGGCPT